MRNYNAWMKSTIYPLNTIQKLLSFLPAILQRSSMSPTLLDVCKWDQRERRYLREICVLESIQRRASRLALNQHKGEMAYDDRCWNDGRYLTVEIIYF